ncbi:MULTISPECIES: YdcF family protein [unclassified Facklamia]|uniref:YdcF family protein n=1 Tax=Aerococcaceae TaxID=186827 RepID=UPI0013D288A9|nr:MULTISPECIES: YdcF family protein [unclassified Facklamia]QQD65522.1 YdcF family protein [Aerococcaceae bacterium zg-252]
MLYWWLATIFFILSIVGLKLSSPFIHPIVCGWYAITNLIMALFYTSNWLPIFIMRYFLYSMSVILLIVVPFILLALAILILFREIRGQQIVWRQYSNIALAILILLFCGYSLGDVLRIRQMQLSVMISLYSTIAIFLTALFISYLVIAQLVQWRKRPSTAPIIMILGTEIDDEGQVQYDLRKRLDKAFNYYQCLSQEHQEQVLFLVSGGNPTLDGITEAEGMSHYLLNQGIAKHQIIKEPSARNTDENFKFARPYIVHAGNQRPLVVITSQYHLVRAAYYAVKYGIKAHFVGATTKWITWPYSSVREYLALLLLTKEVSFLSILYIIIVALLEV